MISALRCTNYRGKVTCLVAIESIARKTHHLAGEGYIAKFGCQMKQTNLVFDNISVNTTHGITPLRFRVWLIKIRTSIKSGNPTFWQDLLSDQI